MKYCSQCGNQVSDNANFCTYCGTPIQAPAQAPIQVPDQTFEKSASPARSNPLQTVAKLLLILNIVFNCAMIFPCLLFSIADPLLLVYLLFFCPYPCYAIPMCIHYFKNTKQNIPCSIAYKVCVLLFVNQIAGILMLLDKD